MKPLRLIWIMLLLLAVPVAADIQVDSAFSLGERLVAATQHDGNYTVQITDINNATVLVRNCTEQCRIEFVPQVWVDQYAIRIVGSTLEETIELEETKAINQTRRVRSSKQNVVAFELTDESGYVYNVDAEKQGNYYVAEIPAGIKLAATKAITKGLSIVDSKGQIIKATRKQSGDRLELIPENLAVKRMVIHKLQNASAQLRMEDVPPSIRPDGLKAYAIDP
ncbi:MAG: hypothetical protein ACQESG_03735, partial [Nanobdellota archaeon]